MTHTPQINRSSDQPKITWQNIHLDAADVLLTSQPNLTATPLAQPSQVPVVRPRNALQLLHRMAQYKAEIMAAAKQAGIDPHLLAAVVAQESQFNPSAVSPKGAQGLGQLMPGTAKELNVANPLDPKQNLIGAAKYLRKMLNLNKGNTELALASYNAGYGRVKKYNGVPPFQETKNYIVKVMQYQQWIKNAGIF